MVKTRAEKPQLVKLGLEDGKSTVPKRMGPGNGVFALPPFFWPQGHMHVGSWRPAHILQCFPLLAIGCFLLNICDSV